MLRQRFFLYLLAWIHHQETSRAWTLGPQMIRSRKENVIGKRKCTPKPTEEESNVSGPETSTLLIVGLGRVGRCVAQQAAPYFDLVIGTASSSSRATITLRGSSDNLAEQSLLDIMGSTDLLKSCNCSHILVTVPGTSTELRTPQSTLNTKNSENKDDSKNHAPSPVIAADFYDDLIERLMPPKDCWIGVVSTTSVYGNHDGNWVNETSDCRVGGAESARKWIEYEDRWKKRVIARNERSNSCCSALRIFRCAGIYGRSRSALHTLCRQGTAAAATAAPDAGRATGTKNMTVTNRIHEDDIARAILASMKQWRRSSFRDGNNNNHIEIYNLADDLPASRQTVMEYAAQLLAEIDMEPTVSSSEKERTGAAPTSSSRATRRGKDQKRVDNSKMKRQLLEGAPLLFPTYQEGLRSILHQPTVPWKDK